MDSKDVKKLLADLGADLAGIASIDRFSEAPKGYHPLDVLPSCKSVIVFAKRFLAGTLVCNSAVPYTIVRNIISDQMDKIAVRLCVEMEEQGIIAIPTGALNSEKDELTGRSRNIVSAKHAAQAAGLGTIGRHSLLITPEYGSMVWLSAVLTEAELEADPLKEKICTECGLCVDACPVNALENIEMNQNVCWNHAFGVVKEEWRISCHKCRDICPYNFGTKNSNMERGSSVKN